jgi:hypothetical protein
MKVGDLLLLHGLQQGGLGLGGRAVDLVGEQDVGEDRPTDEDGHALAGGVVLLDDVGAGDVGGHQVGRELDALEGERHQAGQRVDHERLGQAGHALEQVMAAGEHGDEQFLQDVALADDDLAELRQHALVQIGKGVQVALDVFGRRGVRGGQR